MFSPVHGKKLLPPMDQASYIETERKRNGIQIVVNAAGISQFRVHVRVGAEIHESGEAVIPRDVRASGCLLIALKVTPMRCGSAAARCARDPAEYGLITERQDVVQ